MKKDKEWLKAQIKDEERELKSVYDNYVPYEKVLIADDINDLIDQLDEPEITEEQALNKLAESYPFSADGINAILQAQLAGYSPVSTVKFIQPKEQKLPVIPQFVAEFIQEIKNRKPLPIILYGALLEAKDIQELFDWIWKNGENHNAFAIAFITGKYEIKKEPEWTVKLDNGRYVDNFIESITGVEVELSNRLGRIAPIRFKDKVKAESVALLVGGEVVEVTNNV